MLTPQRIDDLRSFKNVVDNYSVKLINLKNKIAIEKKNVEKLKIRESNEKIMENNNIN